MDYEKKYNEALKDMRAIYPNLKGDAKLAVEHAFPELKESEDERIKRELIEAFTCYDPESSWNGIPVRDIIAYLEKQKEQKPAEWSEEDDNALTYLHELIGFGFSGNFMDAQTAADMRKWVNEKLKKL